MGVACSLHRATETEIEHLLANPDALGKFLNADQANAPSLREVRPKGVLGWLLRFSPITITEAVSVGDEEATVRPRDPDRAIDIEKAWHGLHFLLTGTADDGDEPSCYFIRGGTDLDDEGHTRALRPQQVRRFAEYLSTLTVADLRRRYAPERMSRLEIYPDAIWNRPAESGHSPLEWLTEYFLDVQRFINKAAAASDGVIIDIS